MASKDLRSYVKSVGLSRTPIKYAKVEFGEVYRDVPELVSIGASPNQEGTYDVNLQEIGRSFMKLAVKRTDSSSGWTDPLSVTFSLRSRSGVVPPMSARPATPLVPRHERTVSRETIPDVEADSHKRLLLQGDKFLNFSSVRGPIEELQADDAGSDSDESPRSRPPPVVVPRLSSTGPWECELRCSADLREFHIKQELQVVVLPAVELMNVVAGRKTPGFLKFDGSRQEAALDLLSLSIVFQSATLDLQIPKGTKNGVRKRFELLNSLTWLKCNVEVQKRSQAAVATTVVSQRSQGFGTSMGSRSPGPGSEQKDASDVYGICDACKLPVTKSHERALRENGTYVHLRCQKLQTRSPPPPPERPARNKSIAEGVSSGPVRKKSLPETIIAAVSKSVPRSPVLKPEPPAVRAPSPRKSLSDFPQQPQSPLPSLFSSSTSSSFSSSSASSSFSSSILSPSAASAASSCMSSASSSCSPSSSMSSASSSTSTTSSLHRKSLNLVELSPHLRTAPTPITLATSKRELPPLSLSSEILRRESSPKIDEDNERKHRPSPRKEVVSPLRLDTRELSPGPSSRRGRLDAREIYPSPRREPPPRPELPSKPDEDATERKRQESESMLLHVRNQLSRLQAEVSKQEQQMREKEQKERDEEVKKEVLRQEALASIENLKQSLREEQSAVRREREERELGNLVEVEQQDNNLATDLQPRPSSLEAHLVQVERDRREINRLFGRFRDTETSDSEENNVRSRSGSTSSLSNDTVDGAGRESSGSSGNTEGHTATETNGTRVSESNLVHAGESNGVSVSDRGSGASANGSACSSDSHSSSSSSNSSGTAEASANGDSKGHNGSLEAGERGLPPQLGQGKASPPAVSAESNKHRFSLFLSQIPPTPPPPPPPPSRISDNCNPDTAAHKQLQLDDTTPPRKSSNARVSNVPMPARPPPSRPLIEPFDSHNSFVGTEKPEGNDAFDKEIVHQHNNHESELDALQREEAHTAKERQRLEIEKQKLIQQAKDLAERNRIKKQQKEQKLLEELEEKERSERERQQRELKQQQEQQLRYVQEQMDSLRATQKVLPQRSASDSKQQSDSDAKRESEARELQEWEELIERERTERAIGKEKAAEERIAHAKAIEAQEWSEWENQLESERVDTDPSVSSSTASSSSTPAEMSRSSSMFHHRRASSRKSPVPPEPRLSLRRSGSPDRAPPTQFHPGLPARAKSDKTAHTRRPSENDSFGGTKGISPELEALSKNFRSRPGFLRRSLVSTKPGVAEKGSLTAGKGAVAPVDDEPDAIDERLMAELKGLQVGSSTSSLLSNYTPVIKARDINHAVRVSNLSAAGQDDVDDELIDEALTSMEETHTEIWKRLARESRMHGPPLAGRLFRVAADGAEVLAYECAEGSTVTLAFGATVRAERQVAYLFPGEGEVLINFSTVAEAHSELKHGDLISFVTTVGWDEQDNLDEDSIPVFKFLQAGPENTKASMQETSSTAAQRSKLSLSMMPSGSNKAAERGLYYVKLLQAGHSIVKYGKSGKPHVCTLTVSHDLTKLIWSDNRSSFVFIRDLVSVVPGRMHPNFARYDKELMKKFPVGDSNMIAEQAFKETISITLEFEKRSLSFELAGSATEKDRDRLVAAIAWIKKQEATTAQNGNVDWDNFSWSVSNVFTTFRGPDLEILTRRDIKFIKHGVLTRHTRFKPIEWWLFLFQDMLVIATPADDTTNKLTIQSVTPLVELRLDDQVDKAAHLPPDLCFTLLLEPTNLSVPFICPDAQTRNGWITTLTDAILAEHTRENQGRAPSRHEIFLGTIHSAAFLGQKDKLKALLAQEPSLVDRKDSQGNTALHICAERGHYKLVKTLLRCKALTNIPGARGMVPLWECCTSCDPTRPRYQELIQLLVGPAISDADLLGPDVPTPLHVAISDVFVQGLPEHRGGLNLLQILTLMWRADALLALMRALPFEQQLLIDFQMQPGTAPLFLAVRRAAKLSPNDGAALHRLDFIKKLLQCGAQPNLREDHQLKTALHLSGNNGGVQNVLVSFGARTDIMDGTGERALSSAQMKLTASYRAAFVASPPPKPDKEVKVDHWEATCQYRKEVQCKMRRRTPHESRVDPSDLKDGLVELLGSHLGYLYLLAQVKSEFSSENLLFWKRLQDYKKDASSTKALELFRGFVVENAPQQVNISSITRAKTEKAWANYLLSKDLASLSHVFEVAGSEVMDLMAADSFKRFKGSENFANFKQGKVPAGFCLICLEPATPPVYCRRCAARCCQMCTSKCLAKKAHRRVTLAGLHADPSEMDIAGAPICDGCHNYLSAL